jgi:MoaA/NifB/PqqE/SkfB family radical SAM enzyme
MEKHPEQISLPKAVKTFLATSRDIGKRQLSPEEIENIASSDARIVKAVSRRLVNFVANGVVLFEKIRSFGKEKPRIISPESQTLLLAAYTQIHNLETPILTNLIRNRLMMENSRDPSAARKDRRQQKEKELGIKLPWSLVIDVTSSCNINPPCKGCYAAEYPHAKPTLEQLNGLAGEAEQLGINYLIFSGGEPLTRETELQQIMKGHPFVNYAIFTNGTLIGEHTPDRFLATGAVSSMFIHIEGDQEATDGYMGKGAYDRITSGMRILKDKGFPFGFAITVNQENFDKVTSDEFISDLRNKGCWGGIFFPYVPIGRSPRPDLMLTSEQRQKLADISTKAQKEGLLAVSPEELYRRRGGCMAGLYASVTVEGKVQPCVFIHASDSASVYEQSLETALKGSQLLRATQAETKNSSGSCLIRDRNGKLAELVGETSSASTEK